MRRQHHFKMKYVLSHVAQKDPGGFRSTFSGPRAQQVLEDLWDGYGRSLDAGQQLDSEGLRVEVLSNEDVLITFPDPVASNEAYFLLAHFEDDRIRTFLLERSGLPGVIRISAVVVEIKGDGRVNYGQVDEVTAESFLAKVWGILGGSVGWQIMAPFPKSKDAS